ncbi:MAG: hypothetical protein H0U28_02490 [Nocardioidaceae bacterium]|nr:hypothetical protein [Nocardioidaceae bacterium]
MTEGAKEPPIQDEGVPSEEDVADAKVKEQLETDPEDVPNAPNRDPFEDPDPMDPGPGSEPDPKPGTESFERPGESSNWQGQQRPD